MKGREAGTEEYQRAARYVATQFEKAGLKPAGEKGYFQGVPLHQVRFDPGASTAELIRAGSATKLKWLQQIAFRMQEQLPGGLEAPLVFAGTGEAPVGFQATGKIIVQLTGHTSRAVPGGAVVLLAAVFVTRLTWLNNLPDASSPGRSATFRNLLPSFTSRCK